MKKVLPDFFSVERSIHVLIYRNFRYVKRPRWWELLPEYIRFLTQDDVFIGLKHLQYTRVSREFRKPVSFCSKPMFTSLFIFFQRVYVQTKHSAKNVLYSILEIQGRVIRYKSTFPSFQGERKIILRKSHRR